MGGYLVNFAVYTCAMVGVIFLALWVFKKSMMPSCTNRKDNLLNIIESLSLSPRKTIHVVKAGNERFLIAADLDRTTFLTRLDDGQSLDEKLENRIFAPVNPTNAANNESNIRTKVAKSWDTKVEQNSEKKPFMRELLRKLNTQTVGEGG